MCKTGYDTELVTFS